MKSRSLHNSIKNGFMIFFTVTQQSFMKYHLPPCFQSRNFTKNNETHPPTMRDVIIEKPPMAVLLQLKDSPICSASAKNEIKNY